MKSFYLLLLSLLSFPLAVASVSTAVGIVYRDVNANGTRDASEPGISDVSVSNGVEVARTDALGRYELPVDSDAVIFVIKPNGYRVALDEYNLPKSYYIHKPKGSPSLRYGGVPPTGALPASIDFGLIESAENEEFSALVFGDSQVYDEIELGYFRDGVVSEVKSLSGISFGITLGDLVGDNLSLHEPYKRVVSSIGIPWYNVIGNHDMNYDAVIDEHSDETFERNFGPSTYAFNYGGAHFVVLDDILYPDTRSGGHYHGGFRADQMLFLRNDLSHISKESLIILSMHIPLTNTEGYEGFGLSYRDSLYNILKDYPHVLVLSAHTHFQRHEFLGSVGGVKREAPIHEYNVGTTCGDWYAGVLNDKGLPVSTMRDGTPLGYAILRVSGNRYVLDYRVLGKPAEYRMSLYHPKVVAKGGWSRSYLYANFFMGSASDTLEYRVDGDEWRRMARVEEVDPGYYHDMQAWDYADSLLLGRRPSQAVNCVHLWRGRVMNELELGNHEVEVRAKDMFGRVFTDRCEYRIEEEKKR
jgi:hypothetical protein